MTHTRIKAASMIGALVALVAPCAAQVSTNSWTTGGYPEPSANSAADAFYGHAPVTSQQSVAAGKTPPTVHQPAPQVYPSAPGPVTSNSYPPVSAYSPAPAPLAPHQQYAAPATPNRSRAYAAPAQPTNPYAYSYGYPPAGQPGFGTAYPGIGLGYLGSHTSYPGFGHSYPGLGFGNGYNYGIPPFGGNLPGLGYAGPGGLHTPGLYSNPYLGSPALLHNPNAIGLPGSYGLGPFGF